QLGAVVRAARVQLGVELIRQVLLRVIVRRQIAFFLRTVRRDAFARIVNPAHDVIEVRFFTDTLEVCGKFTADLGVAFADRVTRKTATTLEKRLAVLTITLRLRWQLVVEALLPEVSSDRLDLFCSIFVAQMSAVGRAFRSHTKAPERRHLRSG